MVFKLEPFKQPEKRKVQLKKCTIPKGKKVEKFFEKTRSIVLILS